LARLLKKLVARKKRFLFEPSDSERREMLRSSELDVIEIPHQLIINQNLLQRSTWVGTLNSLQLRRRVKYDMDSKEVIDQRILPVTLADHHRV
jgi:hypothetical protein